MFTKLNSLCEVVETQRLQLQTLKTENQQLQQQVATLQKNQSRMLSLFQQLTGQTIPSVLFGTALIDGFRETLQQWLDDSSFDSWRCCFRSDEHGWEAKQCREGCVDVGAVLVIVRSTAGAVFGAFTRVGFHRGDEDGVFVHDDDSFLFVLESPFLSNCPQRFKAIRGVGGILVDSSCFAVFGSESESALSISSNCNTTVSDTYGFPGGFTASGVGNDTINGKPTFVVSDIEVYCEK